MREFPQASEVEINPLVWLIPIFALVFVTLAVIQWRRKRKAGAIDAALWILAALFLAAVAAASGDRRDVWRTFEPYWAAVAFVAIIGCAVSWIRLFRQEKPNEAAQSVVISFVVLALAFVVALPALQQARETGGSIPPHRYCMHNLHGIGLALYNYEEDHTVWPSQQSGDPPHSWRVAILPYVDHLPLYDEYDFTATWDADVNRTVTTTPIRYYMCPSMDQPERGQPMPTAYALLVGDHTAWTSGGLIDPEDILDGASNSAIVAEACGLGIIWTEPRDIDLATTPIGINLPGDAPGHSPGILSTYHAKGANVLMADGSVRSLEIETDLEVLNALVTADGGDDEGF